MEHIEQAGVHSGDSACSLPAYTLSQEIQDVMRQQVAEAGLSSCRCAGLMNVQFAVKDNEVYLIEVNPRAARTVPFVSKATGVPLAKVAARVMAGKSLTEQGVTQEIIPPYYSVKEVVLPFNKFPGVDPLLGPEMRSTGEVMGVGRTFAEAFAKAQLGSNSTMKKQGRALLSRPRRRQRARGGSRRQAAETGALSWMPPTVRRLCWAKPVSTRVW
ncbi:carbamoyl-phosphate synthase large chain [Salmonella enterica subsp. enterica]|uniref:Carbamoyl-phosphate synthase large chain n=1 Tax=Salmonella enterica I TaxID=59201 RepID=A0A3S4HS57_SALET|nr:carbamoyl-phosphate synthase large chain [Salmonella enterica subsp. enterica]